MLELEKKMQEEPFDVEVQYCDPDDCDYDCLTAPDWCKRTKENCFHQWNI